MNEGQKPGAQSHADRQQRPRPHDPTAIQDSTQRSAEDRSAHDLAETKPFEDVAASNRQIGPYRLLREIGSGGMGSVWLAEQSAPVKRRVALKLIRAGLDSKQVIARFEAERQALAMMNHHHIARVFDGGVSAQGQPYFAMELVEGIPLTDYCDRHRLPLEERLQLFIDVCRGLQHAHQKGIIHRDIKPSNVLVTVSDGQPIPKIIDFGLAKALRHQQRLTDKTLLTELGQVVGTLTHMSPEQAEVDAMDVDTRTDIYSLGVILYELLTGSTPLRKETTKQQALLKVLALIREQPPQRPSLRLTNSSDTIESVSLDRSSQPQRLRQALSGDLDWIVMKALEKDRTRRYETAAAFADDVERFLRLEPVAARPPTAAYRLKMLTRKHRAAVTAAIMGIALLLTGIAATTGMYFRAAAAQRRAEANLAVANAAKSRAEHALRSEATALAQANTARQLAEALARRNQKVVDVFVDAFRSVDPTNEDVTSETSSLEVLRRARAKLDGDQMADDPLAKATLLEALGTSFFGLGDIESSLAVHRDSLALRKQQLGPKHPDTLQSMHNLAIRFHWTNQLESALALLEETMRLRKQELGDDHRDTLQTMNSLAAVHQSQGRIETALPLYQETIRRQEAVLGHDHPDTLTTMNNLARAYVTADRLDEAIALYATTLRLRKITLGDNHPDTLLSVNNLATGYIRGGRFDDALPLLQETFRQTQIKLGADHPKTLSCMNNLAAVYLETGHLAEAPALFEEVLTLMEAKFGPHHPETLAGMINLAASYGLAGKLDESERLYRTAIERTKAELGPDHDQTRVAVRSLQNILIEQQRFAEAPPWCLEWIEMLDRRETAAPSERAWALVSLAAACEGQGKYTDARQAAEEALQISQIEDAEALRARSILGACAAADSQWDEAQRKAEEAFAALDAQFNSLKVYRRSYLPAAARRLVALFKLQEDASEQARWREKMEQAQRRIEELRKPNPL